MRKNRQFNRTNEERVASALPNSEIDSAKTNVNNVNTTLQRKQHSGVRIFTLKIEITKTSNRKLTLSLSKFYIRVRFLNNIFTTFIRK